MLKNAFARASTTWTASLSHYIHSGSVLASPTTTSQMLCKTLAADRVVINCCIKRFLSDRRYSEKHEWIKLDSNDQNVGTVGISNYAQEALGDVVYVQTPEVGSKYNQDDEVGAIESVKAANEIYTPVSGTILEVNENLNDKPGLINSSCYEDGWVFKIKLNDQKEYEGLMDEQAYESYLKSV